MAGKSTTLTGAAIVIALVFALSTGVAGAAKPGNSANAKKCQGTGYLDWVDAGGNAFASAEACTAYAAKKGNELLPKPVRTFESVCENELGGLFADQVNFIECEWFDAISLAQLEANEAELQPVCFPPSGVQEIQVSPRILVICFPGT